MKPRRPLSLVAALGLQILAGMGAAMPPGSNAAALAVTIGGPFTLVAADGTTVTERSYRGKWLLVFFGYTFCPDTCPTVLNEIAAALEKLGPDSAELQPIFITLDPQRDTSEVLATYVKSFDPRIVGLTGSAEQIAAVAQEYGAYFARTGTGGGAEDYFIDHSSYLYLMNPQGQFVRGFDADTPGGVIADRLRGLLAPSRETTDSLVRPSFFSGSAAGSNRFPG